VNERLVPPPNPDTTGVALDVARAVDELVPITQKHQIEGLVDGVE
jgi:hypothetical protein